MNGPEEVAAVLAKCALYDYRFAKPAMELLAAWGEVLYDLDVNDALAAVSRHYRDSPDKIMPAHIRKHAADIRRERQRHQPAPARALPSRFEDGDDTVERSVRIEHGVEKARGVLGPVLAALAEKSPPPPSALGELRALTPGPADGLVTEEAQ